MLFGRFLPYPQYRAISEHSQLDNPGLNSDRKMMILDNEVNVI
jgi:hypothetical protein